MAASSAAYNIEIITYDILNAFSQACTTFVGQNNGARQYQRCKKILFISILEGLIALGLGISIVFFFGRNLLAIFNNNPEVIETGYIRLMLIMITHIFSLLYEVMSGYLRGFWYFSFAGNIDYDRGLRYPYYWVSFIFPMNPTFTNIMLVFPLSLAITAILIFGALLYCRPVKKRMLEEGIAMDLHIR